MGTSEVKRPSMESSGCEEPELWPPEQSPLKLEKAAEQLGVSSEQLSIQSIGKKLSQPEEEFQHSAEYALHKNADLYQRLA
jgi:hypothetical protein